MSCIKKIVEEGFFLNEQEGRLSGLAMLSLKIALKSYFSTYESMKYFLHYFESEHVSEEIINTIHSEEYCEQSSEAIIHFHHFFELVCKEILRSEDPLLAVDASNKHVIFHKLLKKEEVTEKEQEGLKSIEFSVTIERLCELIKKRNMGSGSLDFFVNSKDILKELNILRNRLLHRGVYILRYPAFDNLVGKFLLPLVNDILNLPEYKDLTHLWKYKSLNCGVDPIDEIVSDFKTNKYDITKIAFLKELGRSAYNNQIMLQDKSIFKFIDAEKISRFEKMAQTQINEANINSITDCPVCGLNTLIVYDDIEADDYDEETGIYSTAWRYTWQVKCISCTFEVNHHLKNPSEYGFDIPDYWDGEKL
ncbi:hypothetical protein [Clostridium butyricum]|uniref:hypothetical protein n=1 Tax=Clostridium butyricum TaxID=1492 RepID=UPI00374F6EA5